PARRSRPPAAQLRPGGGAGPAARRFAGPGARAGAGRRGAPPGGLRRRAAWLPALLGPRAARAAGDPRRGRLPRRALTEKTADGNRNVASRVVLSGPLGVRSRNKHEV